VNELRYCGFAGVGGKAGVEFFLIVIERIVPRNTLVFKEVRLRALQDAPMAFGSTYATECQLTYLDWSKRVERWNGEFGAGFLAMDEGHACGIAGSSLDEKDATRAQLISMWTAPTHRGRGIGRLLVNEVVKWAHGRSARELRLMVTSTNELAMRFYEGLGFTRTGRTQPYPNDATMIEYEMSRPIP
jgi:ribosomal protein S18 acetylase RimI-like enzyme